MSIFRPINTNITSLSESDVPEGTIILDLSWCTKLTKLPKLPEGLETLDLSGCKELTKLPNLPSGLKILNLWGCEGLTELPELPEGLKTLNLPWCTKLTKLPKLPEGLKTLDLSGCEGLTKLPKLPEGLEDLNLSGCTGLKELPELPEGLEDLNLWGCEGLTKLMGLLEGLKTLDLSRCTGLKELTVLPEGLENIYLSGCTGLKELPKLPEGLETLDLRGCTGLKELPKLPEGLETLDLRGCTGLPNTPALIEQLTELEEKNRDNARFQLIWPKHIHRNKEVTQIKKDLAEAYKSYYESDENLKDKEPCVSDRAKYPTFVLFHRYMSESVEERGGMNKVIESIISVAQGIKGHPQILESIDKVSTEYLDACVNQPVAGFTEVANLVNISQQKNIPLKLGASRAIMCINLIRSETVKLKVGEGVEVELVNAMLMKVHEKLLLKKDISTKWPGVPDGVAYQDIIGGHLTDDKINSIYEQVQQELKKPLSDVANFMCESVLQDFWMKQVLTEEQMKSIEITKLREKIFNTEPTEPNSSLLTKLSKSLKEKELEFRKGLLEQSREETNAALQPSGKAQKASSDILCPKTPLISL